MLAVTAIPFAITLGLAFTNYDLVRADDWSFVGLKNYQELLADRNTPQILWNTVYLVVAATVIPMVLGLGLAVLMDQAFRGIGFVRTPVPRADHDRRGRHRADVPGDVQQRRGLDQLAPRDGRPADPRLAGQTRSWPCP